MKRAKSSSSVVSSADIIPPPEKSGNNHVRMLLGYVNVKLKEAYKEQKAFLWGIYLLLL